MPGIDSYTELLLHCDGTDASTTFDDSSGNGRSVSAVATAQVDTDVVDAFGGNNGILSCDGNSDYLDVTDFAELDLASDDFTFDFWVRFNNTSGNQGFFTRQSGGSSYFYLALESGSIRFRDYIIDTVNFSRSYSFSIDTWYHIAVLRYGNVVKLFVNGEQQGADVSCTGSFIARTTNLYIGAFPLANYWLNGYIDEFRFSRGIARWTSNFTPPTSPYSAPSEETVSLEDTVTLDETWQLQTNPEQASIGETINLAELWAINTNPEQASIDDTVNLADSWNITLDEQTDYITKIISYNPLIYVTNTDPAKIVHIDISTPTTPVQTIYEITGCKNAKDVVLNDTSDYFYVICDEGKVAKIEKTNLNNQTIINTGESDTFQLAEVLEDHFITYATTDDSSGEIVMIDESTIKSINTDLRWIQQITNIISTRLDTILGKLINSDLRFKAQITKSINTDLRWIEYAYSSIFQNPITFNDIVVKINGTDLCPLDDVNLKSIVITHTIEEQSIASFTLHRRYDKLDYDNQGSSSQITNNNAVIIQIDGHTEFSGYITNLTADSEAESVVVTAKATTPSYIKNRISIPLATVDENLHVYHCLINDINIDNPNALLDTKAVITNEEDLYWTGSDWSGDIVDAQEFNSFAEAQTYIDSNFSDYTSQEVYPINHALNSEYFKGVQVNLGTEIEQNIIRLQWLGTQSTLAERIENGNFNPKQNWSYFWFAKFTNFITGRIQATLSYLGTTLGSLASDSWTLDGCSYKRQKQLEDTETDLGFYYIGSEPYKLRAVRNGKKIPKYYYEDKKDGLYLTRDAGYNYEDYAKKVADIEYEQLKNINGDILPVTSANITLFLDAYYYYNVNLLSRINITNTTTANIYNGNNGFPLGVKTITINTENMSVILNCDNQKSLSELQEDQENYPDINDDEYTTEEESTKQFSKFDPNTWSYPA